MCMCICCCFCFVSNTILCFWNICIGAQNSIQSYQIYTHTCSSQIVSIWEKNKSINFFLFGVCYWFVYIYNDQSKCILCVRPINASDRNMYIWLQMKPQFNQIIWFYTLRLMYYIFRFCRLCISYVHNMDWLHLLFITIEALRCWFMSTHCNEEKLNTFLWDL